MSVIGCGTEKVNAGKASLLDFEGLDCSYPAENSYLFYIGTQQVAVTTTDSGLRPLVIEFSCFSFCKCRVRATLKMYSPDILQNID